MRTGSLLAAVLAGVLLIAANTVTAAQTNPDWSFSIIESGQMVYPCIAYDPADGQPSVVYWDMAGKRRIRFAHFNGTAWDIATVTSGGGSASLAYAPSGQPAISFIDAKSYSTSWTLNYAYRDSSMQWHVEKIGPAPVENSSLVFDPLAAQDTPLIAQDVSANGKNPSKVLLWRRVLAGVWQSETVATNTCGGVSLAIDPRDRNPSVAYSLRDASQNCAVLALAHQAGGSWTSQVVDQPVTGAAFIVGRFLAFDPLTGFPAIATSGLQYAGPRYDGWNGVGWDAVTVDPGNQYINQTSLAFANQVPYVGYGVSYNSVRVAHRDSATWAIEEVESIGSTNNRLSYPSIGIRTVPLRPSLAYVREVPSGGTKTIVYAEKQTAP